MKPTKKLALEIANILTLSALEPDQELERSDVREITQAEVGEYTLDSFQLDLLTDWVYEIASKRLDGMRRRPTWKSPVTVSTKRRMPATSRSAEAPEVAPETPQSE